VSHSSAPYSIFSRGICSWPTRGATPSRDEGTDWGHSQNRDKPIATFWFQDFKTAKTNQSFDWRVSPRVKPLPPPLIRINDPVGLRPKTACLVYPTGTKKMTYQLESFGNLHAHWSFCQLDRLNGGGASRAVLLVRAYFVLQWYFSDTISMFTG